jgi:hypothetical protein
VTKHIFLGCPTAFVFRIVVLLCAAAASSGALADIMAVGDGDWFDPLNWENNVGNNGVPANGDGETLVTIGAGRDIGIDAGDATFSQVLAVGSATDPDPGASLDVSGGSLTGREIRVGQSGIGALTLEGTGVITAGVNVGIGGTGLSIGHDATGDGTFNMSGGTLNVNGNFDFSVGHGGTGEATLSGTADVNLVGRLLVGGENGGTGTLNVQDNAVVETLSAFLVGHNSPGTLNMSGGQITAGTDFPVIFGNGDNATVTMTGGVINTHRSIADGSGLILAGTADSEVTFTLSGGVLNIGVVGATGSLDVGKLGKATMTVEQDVVLAPTGAVSIAVFEGSEGELIVRDDATLSPGGISVGSRGTGRLELHDQVAAAVGIIDIGNLAGSTGTLIMTGAATLDMTEFAGRELSVGRSGKGTMTMSGTTQANVSGGVFVGRSSGSDGRLQMSDAASLNTGFDFSVGPLGEVDISGGTIDVANNLRIAGSSLASFAAAGSAATPVLVEVGGDVFIGSGGSAKGKLTLDGTDTELSVGDDFFGGSGNFSQVEIVMDGSAVVDVTDAFFLGSGLNSTASLTASGSSTVTVGGQFGSAVNEGGNGTLALEDNAIMTVTGNFDMGTGTDASSTLSVAGDAKLTVGGAFTHVGPINFQDGGTIEAAALTVNDLAGSGTINGDVTAAGTVAPGNSAGTLEITGGLSLSESSMFEIELGGLQAGTDYDQVIVNDLTSLDGGIMLTLLDNFTPGANDEFTILQSGSLAESFAGLPSGSPVDVFSPADAFLGRFVVQYGAESSFNPNHVVLTSFAAVPEPSALLLALTGILCLRYRAYRRATKSAAAF